MSAVPPAGCVPLAEPLRTVSKKMQGAAPYESVRYLYVEAPDAQGSAGASVDAAIAADLDRRMRAFAKEVDEVVASSLGESAPVTRDHVALDIRCDDAWSTTTTLGIQCQRYSYLGGPHPNVDYFAYNFGFCGAEPPVMLTLEALCKPDAPCKSAVLDRINAALLARDAVIPFERLGPGADAPTNFVVTKGGLRFFANDDLPHVSASLGVVDVPFDSLRPVLRDDGPLAPLLAPAR